MHLSRKKPRAVRILYGGSVEPWNAHDILVLPEVGGAPIGGASVEAADVVAALGSTLA